MFLKFGFALFYVIAFFRAVASFLRFAGDTEFDPGVSVNEDVATGVQVDGQLRGVAQLLEGAWY